ncbi:hypothetical protein H0X48_02930 [Candidatus Dependentiae bacterium]|nr:hypothetical protein [Candidatus Dependentiae bacterium]
MKNLTFSYLCMLALFSIGIITLQKTLFGACCGKEQREQSACPNESCDWERSDTKCNQDDECCPGKRCNSFGYCERC